MKALLNNFMHLITVPRFSVMNAIVFIVCDNISDKYQGMQSLLVFACWFVVLGLAAHLISKRFFCPASETWRAAAVYYKGK